MSKEINRNNTWINLKTKAARNKNNTFFPNSSMPIFLLEKLLKNKIEAITVIIKINSKANILKGLKMKDNELFSNNFEAFSDDLKNSLSNKEFKREVMAAIKTAPSSTELNFNFIELNASGKLAGLLRAILSVCFKSISFQVPELKFIRTTGTKYKLVIIKVKRFLSLKFETKLTIREKIYTIISSERMTSTSSIAPVVNIFAMLATRITKVDTERDQNKANLV